MLHSESSVHSDSDAAPLKRWFRESYSPEYLSHPNRSAFEHTSMSFHSPSKSPGRNTANADYEGSLRKRFRAMSLSPRYLSPTVNRSGLPFDEEYVMGCTICGTTATEDAAWTHHASPPSTRPSNRPELVDMDRENSGAYSKIISCRLHRAYSQLSQSVAMREIKLLEGRSHPPTSGSIDVEGELEGEGQLIQTTVVKEVFPTPAVPLTPLNYEDANSLKESVFHNSLAERVVREEERQRVATRRAEYANRVKGFMRVVEAEKVKGMSEDEEVTAAVNIPFAVETQEVTSHTGRTPPIPSSTASALPAPAEEEKREPIRVKAPSSFRNPQRHSTTPKGRDEATPRSSGAESEGPMETASRKNSELAKKKLEEIKMTVRQRREERKSRELRAGTRGTKQENKETEEVQPGVDRVRLKDESTPVVSARDRSPTSSQPPIPPRRSAVIGSSPLRSPAHLSAQASDEEEPTLQPVMAAPERPPQPDDDVSQEPVSISPIPQADYSAEKPQEGLSGLMFQSLEEGKRGSDLFEGEDEAEDPEERDMQPPTAAFAVTPPALSPRFPIVETPAIPPSLVVPRVDLSASRATKLTGKEDEKEVITSGRQYTDFTNRSHDRSSTGSPKPSPRDQLPSVRVVLREERTKVEESVPLRDDATVKPAGNPARVDSRDTADTAEQRGPAVQGRPLQSDGRMQAGVVTSTGRSEPQAGLKTAENDKRGKGQSADSRVGEGERRDQYSDFEAAESGFATITRQGGTDSARNPQFAAPTSAIPQRVSTSSYQSDDPSTRPTAFDQSARTQQFDSQSYSTQRESSYSHREDQSRRSYEESTHMEDGGRRRVEGLSQTAPRRKVAAGRSLEKTVVRNAEIPTAKVSEVASFYKLQWQAAVRIQRAVKRFLASNRRHKAAQTDSTGYISIEVMFTQELLRVLGDRYVISGLRLLGGFAEYLEVRGMQDFVVNPRFS